MKYISHKLVINESFEPQYEITLAVNLEALQDAQILMTDSEAIEVFGIGFLNIMDEIKNHKATNEIQATPASAIKDAVTKG